MMGNRLPLMTTLQFLIKKARETSNCQMHFNVPVTTELAGSTCTSTDATFSATIRVIKQENLR